MDAAMNKKSMAIGVPGLVLQVVGYVMTQNMHNALGYPIQLLGTALLVVGLCFYSMAKGRHWAWGFLGILSCVGLAILAVIPDLNKDMPPPARA